MPVYKEDKGTQYLIIVSF